MTVDIALAIFVGMLIGVSICSVIAKIFIWAKTVGTLRIITIDEKDPYVFLELSDGDICRHRHVILRVGVERHSPHE